MAHHHVKKNQQKTTQNIILAPAQFQFEPYHAPLPAAKTLHYPLPLDRHIKPQLINMHIEQSNPLIVFNELGVCVQEMGWGGWRSKPELQLDPYDEALINEDIIKLEELDQKIDYTK